MTAVATFAALKRTAYRRFAQDKVISSIGAFWLVLVFWCELGALQWRLVTCRWPDRDIASKHRASHILLIADPQLRHPLIYGNGLSRWGRMWEYVRDVTLKRRWHAAINFKRPDAILIMGDMMLGRSVMTESEYDTYFNHFRKTLPAGRTPVHYIPGNDDLGLGTSEHFSKYARRRYNQHFGRPNKKLNIADHTLVLIDAPGLVEEDYKRVASKKDFSTWPPTPNGPLEFIQNIAERDDSQPVILFSHIPLHRPESASCGPLRERGNIRKGVGFGYQNTLGKQTTEWILSNLQPALVFSADDRDYCEHMHVPPADLERDGTPSPQVKEVTVKSFSPVRHIRYPGLHLLSLVPPSSTPTPSFADVPCFLPDELHNYTTTYTPALLLTLLALLLTHYRRARRKAAPLRLQTPSTKLGIAPPDSAVWSPLLTPASARPGFALRTPTHTRADSLTASITAPGTPLSASFFPGSRTPLYDEEDLEPVALAPTFAFRREERFAEKRGYRDDDYESDDEKAAGATFLPAPTGRKRSGGGWTWTFHLNGRRRRITFRLPTWGASERAQTSGMAARRWKTALNAALRDLSTVLWPAALLWLLILWWTS